MSTNSYAKTETQLKFEHDTKLAFPDYYNYDQSDLYHGGYRDSDTRHTFAGYALALTSKLLNNPSNSDMLSLYFENKLHPKPRV